MDDGRGMTELSQSIASLGRSAMKVNSDSSQFLGTDPSLGTSVIKLS